MTPCARLRSSSGGTVEEREVGGRTIVQELIEEAIRGVGFVALKVATFGRYRGHGPTERLFQGSVGLALVLAGLYVVYRFAAR